MRKAFEYGGLPAQTPRRPLVVPRPARSRGHRAKQDARTLDRPPRPAIGRVRPCGLSLAANPGLVPLSLGGAPGITDSWSHFWTSPPRRSADRWAKSRACTAIAAKTFMARPLRWISAISAPSA